MDPELEKRLLEITNWLGDLEFGQDAVMWTLQADQAVSAMQDHVSRLTSIASGLDNLAHGLMAIAMGIVAVFLAGIAVQDRFPIERVFPGSTAYVVVWVFGAICIALFGLFVVKGIRFFRRLHKVERDLESAVKAMSEIGDSVEKRSEEVSRMLDDIRAERRQRMG